MKEEKSYPSPTEEEKLIKERKKKKIIWTSITAGIVAIVTMILLLIFLIPRETKYEIELNSNITGVVLNGQGEYKDGEKVTIVAEEIEGYRFIGWSINGNIISTEKEYTFVIGEDTEGQYTANYAKLYTITTFTENQYGSFVINKIEAIAGESVIVDYQINSENQDLYEVERLYYIIAGDLQCEEYTINNNTFTMPEGNVTIYVEFNNLYNINLITNLTEEVKLEGQGIYIENQSTTIKAPNVEGYRFRNWTYNGEILSTNQEYTIIVDSTTKGTYIANYDKLYLISVEDVHNAVSIVENKTEAIEKEIVEFTIAPVVNYRILSVKVNDDTLTENDGKYTFEMPAEDITIIVTYAEEYSITIDSSASNMITSISLNNAISGEQVVVIANIEDTITDEQVITQEIRIKDIDGGEVPYTVSDIGNSTQYSFIMPVSNVAISIESQIFTRIIDYSISSAIITGYTGDDTEVILPSSYYPYQQETGNIIEFKDVNEFTNYIEQTDGASLIGGFFAYKTADSENYKEVVKDAVTWLKEVMTYSEEKFPLSIKLPTEYSISLEDRKNFSEDDLFCGIVGLFQGFVYNTVLSFSYQIGNDEPVNINVSNGLAMYDLMGLKESEIPNMLPITFSNIKYGKTIACVGEGVDIKVINQAFTNNTNITKVTIPEGFQKIDYQSFENCSSLSQISIPSSISYIDNTAFDNCSSLDYIEDNNGRYLGNLQNPYVVLVDVIDNTISNFNLNNKCKIVYKDALSECSNLVDMNIQGNITQIGDNAFNGCIKLESIIFPESLVSIGFWAFSSCSNLKSVYFQGNLDQWLNIDFEASWSPENISLYINNELVEQIVINKNINRYAFNNIISIKKVIIDEGVFFVGEGAFENCYNLSEITLPTTLSCIEKGTFKNCENLANIIIPSQVITLQSYIFSECSKLNNIIIHSDVIYIDSYAFSDCINLTNVTIESEYVYNNTNGVDYNDCGYILQYAQTVKVLKTIVDNEENTNSYLNDKNNFTQTEEGDYYIYTKVN